MNFSESIVLHGFLFFVLLCSSVIPRVYFVYLMVEFEIINIKLQYNKYIYLFARKFKYVKRAINEITDLVELYEEIQEKLHILCEVVWFC